MPNQMIALQARNPQIADPSRQTAQFANMMNMARQQEAAQRQAQQAQQTMDLAKAKEGREASQAQIENAGKLIDLYTKRAGQTMNAQGYELLLRDMDRDAPDFAATFRANLPPEQFDRNTLLKMVGSIGDNFSATFGPRETQVVQMADGTFSVAVTGGFDKPGVFEMGDYKLAPPGGGTPSAPPSAAPPVAQGANARPTQGAPTTQRDLLEQGVDSRNIPAGNPLKPISMTGGGQPNLAGVVESMMSSGQISQSNLQLMRDAAGPDKDAQLAQILKSNNIQIVPDAQASTRNAVFRPGEDTAPQMQMVQNMGDYRATGRPARGKPPMQSPMPGSAIVPLSRVADEARVQRETPAEVYNKEMARRRAERDALKETGPKPLTPVQEAKLRDNITKDFRSAQATINQMMAPDSGIIASVNAVRKLSPDQKEAITGFSGYVPSILPSSRSADTALKNLKGKVTEMGKSAASLTGAIGQMAVQEWKIVSDMIANLDVTGMEPADLDNQLDIIEATARRAAQTTRDSYENQYAEEFARYPNRFVLKEPVAIPTTRGKPAEAALPRVRSDADFMRLKPGALFIDPDGQKRRKP